jgi:adenosylcobinamide-GDP ribazoletransferase
VLAIMKDSRTGTFGAVAIVFVLLAKWIALAKLVEAGAPEWIIAACIVSRTMQVELAVANPYARAGGGTAAAFVNGAKTFHFIAALVSAAILLFGVCGPRWMWLALVPSWFAARALGISSRRRIGGVTGDILGAANEIVELLVLGVGATLAAIGGAGRA